SWDPNRVGELQSLRDRVPPPSVYHVYVDVGVDKPVNTAITTFDMKPQIVPANQPVVVNVTVEAVGGGADKILVFSVDGEGPQRQTVNPGPDGPVTRQFVKTGLKPGLHQAKLSLLTSDALPFDNEKYITFRVREPRNVLALVDAPQAAVLGALGVPGAADGQAGEGKRVLDARGWDNGEGRQGGDAGAGRIDWGKYEQVTLLDVIQPTAGLWKLLEQYVQKGGHLVVTPPGPGMDVTAYQRDAARAVLPRVFDRWVEAPPKEPVTWTWNALSPTRPLLAVFRQDKENNAFYEQTPPITSGFWEVESGARDRVVVAYNNAPTADERSPAVLEWGPGGTAGRVIQFTVPMGLGSSRFHNYASTWFYLVLVNEAVRTLVGDTEDQVFNFTAGQNVVIKWPTGDVKPGTTYFLSGPDVTANDATIRREEGQAYLRFG